MVVGIVVLMVASLLAGSNFLGATTPTDVRHSLPSTPTEGGRNAGMASAPGGEANALPSPTHPTQAVPLQNSCERVRASELLPTRASDRAATLRCAANAAAGSAAPSSGAPGWSGAPTLPPGFEIYNQALTYDAADGYLLLFGSVGGSGPLNGTETWTYAAGVWTQLHPATSPESCLSSALAYDSVDHYVVYFGGGGWYGGNCTSTDQTWTFSGGAWAQIHPASPPPALEAGSFTNDSGDGYLLLFGGLLDTATLPQPTNATWSFVGGVWTQLHPATTPPARSSGGLTDDLADGYVLLFGGNGAGYTVWADTWSFVGGVWTQLHPSSHPIAPWPDGLTYDASDGVVVYTSAENLSNPEPEQVWTFTSGVWTEWLAGPGNTGVVPPERLAEATAYDWGDGYYVLFGGSDGSFTPRTDLWSFHAGNWTNLTPNAPSPRELAAESYDAADGYLLLFGGAGSSGYLSDTWKWASGTWTLVHTNQSPPARAEAGLTYDAADGYVLLFGGAGASGPLNDTWEYTNGGWTQITPAVAPPPADAYQTMAYDSADGYVLLVDEGNLASETTSWAYLAGTWTNLTARSGGTTPEPANGIAYDSMDARVVLYGTLRVTGGNSYGYPGTWTFLNGNWTNVTSTVGAAPPARELAAMTYDSDRGYVLLFGGVDFGLSNFLNDTWTFSANAWTEQLTDATPSG
ncbi:MAG: hypothetical protein L3K02_00875, partial [Thermoplasmata archaeon]|nr:hypothetical protein [Thermoplasmata archaeon]